VVGSVCAVCARGVCALAVITLVAMYSCETLCFLFFVLI
jgi:hypothetical protein